MNCVQRRAAQGSGPPGYVLYETVVAEQHIVRRLEDIVAILAAWRLP